MIRERSLKEITGVASALGLRSREVELHGRHKAKINLSTLDRLATRRRGKYILVSAITPTPLGEGKTVTTIGLSMALNRLRVKSACTLRQASLGPLFGAKGTGTGGGASQILPQDDVNLHFTGDLHAISTANNLLVAFLENSVFHGNRLDIAPDSLYFKRCLDIGDRSLRHITYQLKSNGTKTDMATGFEITAASEVMSLVALSRDFNDMRERLRRMVVARRRQGIFVTANDIKADGMMAVVLKDAIKPNLVQTSEGTPCFVHAGPFANISVGTCSVIADRMALGLCDYVVTESGFGVDCGGEKFFDIKCRYSGFSPDACVLVCSVRGVKAQSSKIHITPGVKIDPALFEEDLQALAEGIVNLKKHIENVRIFGIPVIVAINPFPMDTEREIAFIREQALVFGAADCVVSRAWEEGSRGALELAQSVLKVTQKQKSGFRFLYEDSLSLKEKIQAVATKIYGAGSVDFSQAAQESLEAYTRAGYEGLPVCIAKTQFSFSADEALKGAPSGYVFPVKDVRLASGAGFVLAHASLMQAMPGLPVEPRGEKADVDSSGHVIGLS
jgi:formate--tetrahydrofolate ligase